MEFLSTRYAVIVEAVLQVAAKLGLLLKTLPLKNELLGNDRQPTQEKAAEKLFSEF
jgi:hypothetical protein